MPNGSFSLELAEDVASIACSHCGEQLTSVCGFITRDGNAYSTYFGLLHTGHDEIVVLLTISIGKWWDDEALNERHWVALTVKPSETHTVRDVLAAIRCGISCNFGIAHKKADSRKFYFFEETVA